MTNPSPVEDKIAAIARRHLEDRFHNQIAIISVRVNSSETHQHQGRLTMDVAYQGDGAVLHPQRFKGISRRMQQQLLELGIRDPLIERYTHTTDGEWSEPVQASPADGGTTEIDASLPFDEADFQSLADEWLEHRPKGVDVAQMVRHPAYQGIIDIGSEAVPWLLQRLAQRPDHWFCALNQITNANPVQPEHKGNIKAMAEDWIAWGKQNQS